MSSYLPYNFDFSPMPSVFVPDFNFYTNVLGVATQRYNAAVEKAGELLGSYFMEELSNAENEEYRKQYYNSVKNQISAIAATDLSDPANFSKLRVVVDQIANDEDILKDINYTRSYKQSKTYLNSLRFNAPDIHLKDGKIDAHNYLTYDKKMDELLDYERMEFANQKRGEMKAMKASQVYGLDYVRLANDYLKSLDVKVETIELLGPTVVDQPSFIVKTNLGEMADYNISNALNRFMSSNSLVKGYFTNEARHDVYRFEHTNKGDTTQTAMDLLNRLNTARLVNYDLINVSVDKSRLLAEEKQKIKEQTEALLAGGTLDGAIKAQTLIEKYNNLDKNEKEINKTKEETDTINGMIEYLTKLANEDISKNKGVSSETYNKIKNVYQNIMPTLRINEESFKLGYDWTMTHISKNIKENALARAHIFGRYNAIAKQAENKDTSYYVPPSLNQHSSQEIAYFYHTGKGHINEDDLLSMMTQSAYAQNPQSFISNTDFKQSTSTFNIKKLSESDINRLESSLSAIESDKGKWKIETLQNSKLTSDLGFSKSFINELGSVDNYVNTAKSYLEIMKNRVTKVGNTSYSETSAMINLGNGKTMFVGVGQVRVYNQIK